MTNPFDAQDGTYRVLTNAEGQHSLWPAFADVPPGWSVVHGPADRGDCLEYVNARWTDLRPRAASRNTWAVRPDALSGRRDRSAGSRVVQHGK